MLPLFATNLFAAYAFQISFIVWLVPELILSFTRRGTQGTQIRDRASRFILLGGIFIGMFLAINGSFAAPQLAIPWNHTMLFWIGISLMLIGVAFRWYAILALGKYFTGTVMIQTGQTVVERGPYRFIRHPSYTGALITFLGVGLALSNWLGIGLILLAVTIGYGYRVHVEEQALVEALGQPYLDYMKRTKRFIPFVF